MTKPLGKVSIVFIVDIIYLMTQESIIVLLYKLNIFSFVYYYILKVDTTRLLAIKKNIPGCVAQMVTCLTADPGVIGSAVAKW